MSGEDFSVGDLVWAKMKGFSFWPGCIKDPPKDAKPKKSQYYVYFFGSENCGWVPFDAIKYHSEEEVKNAKMKKMTSSLKNAIDRIVKESSELPKKNVPVKTELQSPPKTPTTPEKPAKSPKLTAKVKGTKSPKSPTSAEKDAKEPKPKTPKKTPPKKRLLIEEFGAELTPSPSKIIKMDEGPVHSSAATSRVAVIKPYDDSLTNQSPVGILFRRDYVSAPPIPEVDLNYISDTIKKKSLDITQKKIGFLGLGTMGSRIARNLLNTGHNVTVWCRAQEKRERFKQIGGQVALTPADVVESCDLIFSCVSTPLVAKTLVFGNNGILQGFDKTEADVTSKGYIEMTSVDPETSKEIAEAITQKGGRYLEAPISGSKDLAEEGSLLILGSGDRDLFYECESVFGAISMNTYYLSCAVGSGSKMNLIMSMLLGVTYAALGEAMALVDRLNLNQNNFLEILHLSPLNCPQLIEKGKTMTKPQFETVEALKYQQQNLVMALNLNQTQPLPVTSAANELFKHAKLLRYSDHDVAAVYFGAKH